MNHFVWPWVNLFVKIKSVILQILDYLTVGLLICREWSTISPILCGVRTIFCVRIILVQILVGILHLAAEFINLFVLEVIKFTPRYLKKTNIKQITHIYKLMFSYYYHCLLFSYLAVNVVILIVCNFVLHCFHCRLGCSFCCGCGCGCLTSGFASSLYNRPFSIRYPTDAWPLLVCGCGWEGLPHALMMSLTCGQMSDRYIKRIR